MRGINKKLIIILIGIVALLFVGYLAGAVYYSSHLMKGTEINGIAVSGKTTAQVKKAMEEYELTIYEKTVDGDSFEEKVTGDQLGLKMTDESAIKEIIKKQGVFSWILNQKREYQVGEILSVDESKLSKTVNALKGFSSENIQEAKDAYISEYTMGKGYEIVSEIEGNRLDQNVTIQKVTEAALSLEKEIDLAKADCYVHPKVTSEDKKLNQLFKQLKTYTSAVITYDFGENQEVLDGDTIHSWLKVKKNKVVIPKTSVEEYVKELRRSYDTIFTSRTFQTSYGKKVRINGGDYGWWMNTAKETAQLKSLIKKGKVVTRTPEYLQEAASYGEVDYGDSYVEINLTAQHLLVYQNGKRVFESDFVSGNVSAGNGTPAGVYSLTYKEEMAELVGENYATPVSYWMPFNGNIGMHDATWRSQFGGSLYKTGGSHGCINLPYAAAKKIYTYVEKGSPVICYELNGAESGNTTGQSNEQIAKAVIESINKIGKVTLSSRERIKHSRSIYNELNYSQRKLVTNYNKLIAAEAILAG